MINRLVAAAGGCFFKQILPAAYYFIWPAKVFVDSFQPDLYSFGLKNTRLN